LKGQPVAQYATDDDGSDSFARFLRHLPKSDDLSLIILKGHLLIEEELNDALAAHMADPDRLFQARLSFSQRLNVLVGITGEGNAFHHRLTAVEKLNSLRNQLAHNLEPKGIGTRIEEFLRELEDPGSAKELRKQKVSERLKSCIALMCGEFSGWKRAARMLRIPHSKDTESH
jgi:hypothetical protein